MKFFPIMDGPDIPWAAIEPHRPQVMLNHGQTLERLAERGGLSCFEAVQAITGRGLHARMPQPPSTERETLKILTWGGDHCVG